MTGGAVVILGKIGMNFAAGMTGGDAFVYDPDEKFSIFVNDETVHWNAPDRDAEEFLKHLIERHLIETRSRAAKRIRENWSTQRARFRHVSAKDNKVRLAARGPALAANDSDAPKREVLVSA